MSTHPHIYPTPPQSHQADEFAAKHSIPVAYEGYAQLCEDPEVQVVYIGTLHAFHR